MALTYSCMMYNGEREILRLHLEMTAAHIDKFIICEAKTTFSGYKKPLYFFRDQYLFRKWWPKIELYVIDENYSSEEREQARLSPNTHGAAHWQNEFLQKESLKKALKAQTPQDTDILLVGDVDEILNFPIVEQNTPYKARLLVYAYYLNNESNEAFWGTLVAKWGEIKDNCLNHMRSDPNLYSMGPYQGYHFTSMGGLKEVQRKLNDSYTTESHNTYKVQEKLPERHAKGEDYLGRPFTFIQREDNWPQFLKQNRKKYEHLLWQK